MKILILALIFGLMVGCATVPKNIDEAQLHPTWCCCKVSDGSICCNWTNLCPTYIPGCICAW